MAVAGEHIVFVHLHLEARKKVHGTVQVELLVRDLVVHADLVNAILNLLLHQRYDDLHLVLNGFLAFFDDFSWLNIPVMQKLHAIAYFSEAHSNYRIEKLVLVLLSWSYSPEFLFGIDQIMPQVTRWR